MRWGRAGLGYLAFFALLFLPLALRGALPGNCDTWLNGIALPNYMLSRIEGALTHQDVGRPLYPATGVLGFGESAPGTSAVFIVFKLLTRDDALSYYLFVVVLLALDALGVALLASLYVRETLAAVFAGLAFAASNYVLANLDSPHTSFFAVALGSLYCWKRYLLGGERRALFAAAILGGVQAYFSAYVFLFLLLAALALLAAGGWRRVRGRGELAALAGAALLGGAIAAPFFAFYARASASANFANPWDPVFLAEVHSLEPSDLVRTLENNVLYPFDRRIVAADIAERTGQMIQAGVVKLQDLRSPDAVTVFGSLSSPDDVKYFVYTRRCAFLGFVLYALGVAGLIAAPGSRRELIFLYVGGLVVSFGPFIAVGHWLLPNLTLPVYRWLDLAGVLRVPCRAFALSALAVAVAAAVGAERFLEGAPAGRRRLLLAALTLAVLLENVPVPLKSFAGASLARPEPLVLDFFKGQHGHVVLDLPSRPGGALFRDSTDLFEWNRELVYMNRQTYHRQSSVNGVHGYFPRSRIQAQRLIDALPAARALAGLRALGVDYVVYHHALELPWEEKGLYVKLAASPELTVAASSADVTIFAWAARVAVKP